MNSEDAVRITLIAAGFAAIAVLYVHSNGQSRVRRDFLSTAGTAVRTMLAAGMAVVMLRFVFDVPGNLVSAAAVVTACLLPAYTLNPRDAEDPLSLLFSILLFLPAAPVFFVIFGPAIFQDRNETRTSGPEQ